MSFLLSKIFQYKNLHTSCADKSSLQRVGQRDGEGRKAPVIRLVVFKDHDVRGRSVVFDSLLARANSAEPQGSKRSATGNAKQAEATISRCQSAKAQTTIAGDQGLSSSLKTKAARPPSDTDRLGEMMFGSVSMTYKGASLKVHSIRSPRQLMITKVFTPTRPLNRDCHSSTPVSGSAGEESFDSYSFASGSGSALGLENPPSRGESSGSSGGGGSGVGTTGGSAPNLAFSVPMAVPFQSQLYTHPSVLAPPSQAPPTQPPMPIPPPQLVLSPETNDHHDLVGSVSSVTSLHTSLNSSLQASPLPSPDSSMGNSVSTSGTGGGSLGLGGVVGGGGSSTSYNRRLRRSLHTSLESPVLPTSLDTTQTQSLPANKRPPQFGIGLVFNLAEDQEEANLHFETFVFTHITLLESHVNKLTLTLERSLLLRQHPRSRLVEALESFREAVLDLYLTPRIPTPIWLSMMTLGNAHKVQLCERFIKDFVYAKEKFDGKNNRFLSCLLTGVLTYHLSWVPTVAPAGSAQSAAYLHKHSAKWLDTLAKSHPYNPLWAQLGDMYGAIGFPLRQSRTVITGRRADVIKRLLYLMTYFIRCSAVSEESNIGQCESLRLDKLEYRAARSEEIRIPDVQSTCSGSNGKSGSQNSGQSYQTQLSSCVCTQCGRTLESVPLSENSSVVTTSERSPAALSLSPKDRNSSVDEPSSVTSGTRTVSPLESERKGAVNKRQEMILKLLYPSFTRTTNISTQGVPTVVASHASVKSSAFPNTPMSATVSSPGRTPTFETDTRSDFSVDVISPSRKSPPCDNRTDIHDFTVLQSKAERSYSVDETQNSIVSNDEAEIISAKEIDVAVSNTTWYVTLEERYAEDQECSVQAELENSSESTVSLSVHSTGAVESNDSSTIYSGTDDEKCVLNMNNSDGQPATSDHSQSVHSKEPNIVMSTETNINSTRNCEGSTEEQMSIHAYQNVCDASSCDISEKVQCSHDSSCSFRKSYTSDKNVDCDDGSVVDVHTPGEKSNSGNSEKTLTRIPLWSTGSESDVFSDQPEQMPCPSLQARMRTSFRRVLDSEQKEKKICRERYFTPTRVSLYPSLVGANILEDPYSKGVTESKVQNNHNSFSSDKNVHSSVCSNIVSKSMNASNASVKTFEKCEQISPIPQVTSGLYPSLNETLSVISNPSGSSTATAKNKELDTISTNYSVCKQDTTKRDSTDISSAKSLSPKTVTDSSIPSCEMRHKNSTKDRDESRHQNGSDIVNEHSKSKDKTKTDRVSNESKLSDHDVRESRHREWVCFVGRHSNTSITSDEIQTDTNVAFQGISTTLSVVSRDSGRSSCTSLPAHKEHRTPDSGVFEMSLELAAQAVVEDKTREKSGPKTVLRASKTTYMRLESSDSIFDDESSLPVFENINNTNEAPTSESSNQILALNNSVISNQKPLVLRGISLFDDLYDDHTPVPLPSEDNLNSTLTALSAVCNTDTASDNGRGNDSLRNQGSQCNDETMLSHKNTVMCHNTSSVCDKNCSNCDNDAMICDADSTLIHSDKDTTKASDDNPFEQNDTLCNKNVTVTDKDNVTICDKDNTFSDNESALCTKDNAKCDDDKDTVSVSHLQRALSCRSGETDVVSVVSDCDSLCSDCLHRSIDRSNSFSPSVTMATRKQRATLHKQTSTSSATGGTPGRCRSVTPTELNRRRLNSANGSLLLHELTDSLDLSCDLPTAGMHEVVMPRSPTLIQKPDSAPSTTSTPASPKTPPGSNPPPLGTCAGPELSSLGRSLLADPSDHYMADFALQGTVVAGQRGTSYGSSLLSNNPALGTGNGGSDGSGLGQLLQRLHSDLRHAVSGSSVLDEPVAEAAAVLADTEKMSVKVLTCQYSTSDRVHTHELLTSRIVADIVDSVYSLSKLKMSPEFCVMHLEDRLQEIYFKSHMLSEYMKTSGRGGLRIQQLAAALGFADSDIPLLLSVAGTHSPRLSLGLIDVKPLLQ